MAFRGHVFDKQPMPTQSLGKAPGDHVIMPPRDTDPASCHPRPHHVTGMVISPHLSHHVTGFLSCHILPLDDTRPRWMTRRRRCTQFGMIVIDFRRRMRVELASFGHFYPDISDRRRLARNDPGEACRLTRIAGQFCWNMRFCAMRAI
jgi:hypothetical protein